MAIFLEFETNDKYSVKIIEIRRNVVAVKFTADLARLHLWHKTCWVNSTLGSPDWTVHLWHKTCWVNSTLGSPDWTVRVNACTAQAWIIQLLECGK